MTVSPRSMFAISAVTLLSASIAGAQTNPSPGSAQQPASTTGSNESSRPATTTFYGNTGLWYVPTAETLPHGQFSITGYRRGTNYIQGYTNVADFAGTFGVGIRDRVELFDSFLFDTRIDRAAIMSACGSTRLEATTSSTCRSPAEATRGRR